MESFFNPPPQETKTIRREVPAPVESPSVTEVWHSSDDEEPWEPLETAHVPQEEVKTERSGPPDVPEGPAEGEVKTERSGPADVPPERSEGEVQTKQRRGSAGPFKNLMLLKVEEPMHAPVVQV